MHSMQIASIYQVDSVVKLEKDLKWFQSFNLFTNPLRIDSLVASVTNDIT